jgi:hypothetical protein
MNREIMIRVRTPHVLALAAILALTSLLLTPATPAFADDSGLFSGDFVIGYRSVDTSGREAKYQEDYNLQDGPRLFGLNFHFTPAPELRAFADRIDLNMTNFGGDPFESMHLGVQKFGAFNFRYDRTKSTYFYADQLIPPELLDVRVDTGGDYHTFDFDRVRDTAKLDIDINDRAKANFGFERFTKSGTSSTTLDLQRDEFDLEKPIDESLNAYYGGIQYAWDKVTVVLQEDVRDYNNSVELFLPGQSEGAAAPPGNGELDYYFLNQPYDYNSQQHTVRILAHPNARFSIKLSGSMQNLDLNLSATEQQKGLTNSRVPFTASASGDGAISRDTDLYNLDLSYMLNDRFTLIGGAYSRKLDQSGDLFFADVLNAGRWNIETTGGEVGLQVSVNPKLTISGGVRSESRDTTWYTSESGTEVKENTDNTGFFGTVGWRPTKEFHLTGTVETNSYNDPFTLASPTDHTRYRLRGVYNLAGGTYVAANYLRNEAKNSNSGWDSTAEQYGAQVGYQKSGMNASIGYGNVKLDRTIFQVTTVGNFDIAYNADSDFVDGQLSWTLAERWVVGGTARYYKNSGSFGLKRTDYYGFVEYDFTQGYLVRVGYRSIDYNETQYNFDDYKADIAEFSVGYRW